MKPVFINDTTLLLCTVTVEGIEAGSRAIDICVLTKIIDGWIDEDGKRDWLNENTPGWMPWINHTLREFYYHDELVLIFKNENDAFAFRLRWL
ncbi:hypothetical protein LNAOJCKE_0398 [Methylorubrum aminovorans]|uniref:Uncharacterized protein n=2 Tax=Methylorubrum aminovorans TaxID=269069 RepID=A0ABQ4U7M4_9HYPH|nr:hypothetical protein LNAOJCKE_0398 [Methylorubrum aminovorans]GMA79245.1 hypothetical protein GCM10025880_56620 [Methylorubrum aminovorans]